jgi:hypothetical protein
MAHTSLTHWSELERFNVSFERIASGSEALDPIHAASALTKQLDVPVKPAREEIEKGRLFLVSELTTPTPEAASKILHGVARSLELAGSLRPKAHGKDIAGSFLKMEQVVENVPVYGAELTLHVKEPGVGYAIVGNPVPGRPSVMTTPKKIAPREAIEVVATALHNSPDALVSTVNEVMLPVPDNALQPCYQVKAFTLRPFGNWYGFIGFDGRLLALYNVASSVVGEASGYLVSPQRGELSRLRLDELDQGLIYLSGPHCQVWQPGGQRQTAADRAFLVDADTTEFDEAQMYYFLTVCRRALAAVAGPELAATVSSQAPFVPMIATVHVPEAVNNAFYNPQKGDLIFGDIEGDAETRYTSRSLDIVLHEYGHAISDTLCRLGRSKPHTQSRAMSEGYSDYFAATFLDNPIIGDYFVNRAEGFRSCAKQGRFPAGYAGEEHAVGEVWAGFLWSLRADPLVGRGVADTLAVQSLSYLGPWRTIPQGLDAILEADRVLFPAGPDRGRHEDQIRTAFGARR